MKPACPKCFRSPCTCATPASKKTNRTRAEKTGTARMLELGYRPIQIWLSPTMAKWLAAAAAEQNQPKARYATEALSMRLAKRNLDLNLRSEK